MDFITKRYLNKSSVWVLTSLMFLTGVYTPLKPGFSFQISQRIPPETLKALNAQSARSGAEEKKARLLLKQGDFAQAEAAYNRAQLLSVKFNNKPNSRLLQLLGDIYLAQGRYRKALNTYDTVRNDKSYWASGHQIDLNTALAYLYLGDLKNAAKFYSQEQFFSDWPQEQKAQAFSQLPATKGAKSLEARIYFARGLDQSGFTEEELENYQKALKLFPRNGLFAYYVAQSLMRLKRYDEALPMWARAARFGKGETARDALNRTGGFPVAQREKAMRDVQDLK